MRYESLRNVAMHFKDFKLVKNAFYSSPVVTRASREPIFKGLLEGGVRLPPSRRKQKNSGLNRLNFMEITFGVGLRKGCYF